MGEKQKEDFFDELDKTVDLIHTFKPSVESSKKVDLKEIEKLYSTLEQQEVEEESPLDLSNETTPEILEEQKKKAITDKVILKKEEPIQKQLEFDAPEKVRKEKKVANKKQSSTLEKSSPKKEVLVEKPMNKSKKTRKVKKGIFELIFCACSFLVMLSCAWIYGTRLIKYYKIYNPKNDSGEVMALLTTEIARNSSIVYEGEGLYMQGGEYVYKGANVKNYVEYSNLLWRIVKTNLDGSIDMVLDDYINVLPFSKDYVAYTDSDIHKWLNEYFIKYLDKEYLTGTKICTDSVSDLNSYSCHTSSTDSYVRILSVKEYLNSKADNTTYVGNGESTLWLNTVSSNGAWQVNGNSLSVALESRALGIKPVVTLKIGVVLLDGEGTKENPYKIEKEKDNIRIGDYVKLGEDIYIVYDNSDNKISLALNNHLPATYRFDINTNLYNSDTAYSLAHYLNNTYYESLSYKDMIIDSEWNIGLYHDSYDNIKENTITAKVGLLSLENLKFNNELSDYFLLNGIDTASYLYGNELVTSKPNISRNIRPCITIKDTSVKSGNGTLENPYVVEE